MCIVGPPWGTCLPREGPSGSFAGDRHQVQAPRALRVEQWNHPTADQAVLTPCAHFKSSRCFHTDSFRNVRTAWQGCPHRASTLKNRGAEGHGGHSVQELGGTPISPRPHKRGSGENVCATASLGTPATGLPDAAEERFLLHAFSSKRV